MSLKKIYKSTDGNKTVFHRSILDCFNFYGCNFKSSQEKECRNLTQKLRNANYKYQFKFAFVERFFFDTVYVSKKVVMKNFDELPEAEKKDLLNKYIDSQDLSQEQKRFAKGIKAGATYDFSTDTAHIPDD